MALRLSRKNRPQFGSQSNDLISVGAVIALARPLARPVYLGMCSRCERLSPSACRAARRPLPSARIGRVAS